MFLIHKAQDQIIPWWNLRIKNKMEHQYLKLQTGFPMICFKRPFKIVRIFLAIIHSFRFRNYLIIRICNWDEHVLKITYKRWFQCTSKLLLHLLGLHLVTVHPNLRSSIYLIKRNSNHRKAMQIIFISQGIRKLPHIQSIKITLLTSTLKSLRIRMRNKMLHRWHLGVVGLHQR